MVKAMIKKLSILLFAIIVPNILSFIYDRMFRYSGNWQEDYQNYFKLGLLIISVFGAGWLVFIAKNEKSYIWLVFSGTLLLFLSIYLYFGVAIINSSF